MMDYGNVPSLPSSLKMERRNKERRKIAGGIMFSLNMIYPQDQQSYHPNKASSLISILAINGAITDVKQRDTVTTATLKLIIPACWRSWVNEGPVPNPITDRFLTDALTVSALEFSCTTLSWTMEELMGNGEAHS
ncbi:hypothetical protein E2C01_009542 [Portunus trituberculatus]|uniref:Uncharacterized protein n=1 Tax=Portunus trituberculatus TaxID=210409 RepID=A0A5B7D619_PORTR|nr:hypothetical protein [Portunus trituberculatus]